MGCCKKARAGATATSCSEKSLLPAEAQLRALRFCNDTKKISARIFQYYKVCPGLVPPGVTTGTELEQPRDVRGLIRAIEVEVYPAPVDRAMVTGLKRQIRSSVVGIAEHHPISVVALSRPVDQCLLPEVYRSLEFGGVNDNGSDSHECDRTEVRKRAELVGSGQ